MDAEMTSIQPAIDLMTNHHARSINTKGSILFGNTYQVYLKESTAKLQHDYHVSKINDVPLGLKIVSCTFSKSNNYGELSTITYEVLI